MTAVEWSLLAVIAGIVAIAITIMELAPVIEGEDGDDFGPSTVISIIVAVAVAVGIYVWVSW